MSNALALPSLNEIGSTAVAAKVLKELTKTGDYLDRLQLYQGTSNVCKTGKLKPGVYGIPRGAEDAEELGDTIDLLVFAAKPFALDTSGDNPISTQDAESAEFKRIEAESKKPNTMNYMAGIQFLVFERSTEKFYTYFASSASARKEAGKMLPDKSILCVTMSARFVKRGQQSWHAPVVTDCSVPFDNVPDVAEIRAQVEKFAKGDTGGREEVKAAEQAPARNSRRR